MSHQKDSSLRPAEKPPETQRRKRWGWAVWALFLIVAAAIYSNTLAVPFVFDDPVAITDNTTIRDLSNLKEVLLPKLRGGTTTDGRPLLNLSLAINYAVSGLDPSSYHAVNIGIHFCNACLLFGLLRRIFALPSMPLSLSKSADLLAFCVALLWLVHPLQTAAITYVIQRAEALMALFYLGTLYCFVRAATAERGRGWWIATALCCWIGQGAKEIMATAPLAVLAIDSAVIAGSVREAFRRRGTLHVTLIASWLLAAALILHSGSRSGTVSFSGEVSPLNYFVAQCGYLLRYLRLAVWPWPQVFDYGMDVPPWDGSQWPQVAAIIMLIAGIFALCWRSPKWGVLGLLPMLILAPTSSFIPVVTHVAAEHRMYLPLASVLTVLVILLWLALARVRAVPREYLVLSIACLLAIGWGLAAHQRNRVFATERTLWESNVRAWPQNLRAYDSLAIEMTNQNEAAAAPALFDRAIAEGRSLPAAYMYRGRARMRAGDDELAIQDFQKAIELDPKFHLAYVNFSIARQQRKEWALALPLVEKAIELAPREGDYYIQRGLIFFNTGRLDLAEADYRKGIELTPFSAEAHFRMGEVHRARGRPQEAIASLKEALYYAAHYTKAEQLLVNVYVEQGDFRRAIEIADALIARRNNVADWELLAMVFEKAGDDAATFRVLDEAVKRHPQASSLRLQMGKLLARQGQWNDALQALSLAEQLDPRSADTAATLAGVLLAVDEIAAAKLALRRALAINPRHPVALRLEAQLQEAKQTVRP